MQYKTSYAFDPTLIFLTMDEHWRLNVREEVLCWILYNLEARLNLVLPVITPPHLPSNDLVNSQVSHFMLFHEKECLLT